MIFLSSKKFKAESLATPGPLAIRTGGTTYVWVSKNDGRMA